MVNILAFDTATNACSVAIQYNDEIVSDFQIAPRKHDVLLLPMIETLLKKVGCQLQELDVVAYGAGPGSFMGVRLALGVAQGLAFGGQSTGIAYFNASGTSAKRCAIPRRQNTVCVGCPNGWGVLGRV